MTHNFIYTSLYCSFKRLLSENVIKKKGVTVVVVKISDLENANIASFLTRRYNGVLWKTHFFGTFLLHKNLFSEKKRVTISFSRTNTVRLNGRKKKKKKTGHNFFFKN